MNGAAREQKVSPPRTRNSARGRMAGGFLRHLVGDRFEAYSAGTPPADEVRSCAVEAMEESGVDGAASGSASGWKRPDTGLLAATSRRLGTVRSLRRTLAAQV